MKMNKESIYRIVNLLSAGVWLVNGLFCKILSFVPRHRQIVERILGNDYGVTLTKIIGCAEMGMAIWLLSGIQRRLNVTTQIIVVAFMNILEYFLAPDLLLWGKGNAVFATVFIVVLYFNEFYMNKVIAQQV